MEWYHVSPAVDCVLQIGASFKAVLILSIWQLRQPKRKAVLPPVSLNLHFSACQFDAFGSVAR